MRKQHAYFATAKGQRHVWHQRCRTEILLQLHIEPQGKATITPEEKLRLQHELSVQMAASGRRRAYTVPVAVQLDFAVTQNDPPAIYTLAKNYLDVLQKVEPSEAIGRRMLLLKDDRQVQFLVCNYQLRPRNAEPGVQIRVASMANLVADLELYERVRRGGFVNIQDDYAIAARIPAREDPEEREGDRGQALKELRKWMRSEPQIVAQWGQKTFDAWRRMLEREAQGQLLRTWLLLPSHLQMLLSGRAESRSKSEAKLCYASMIQPLRNLLLRSPLSFALAPPPTKEGEVTAFKQSVQKALTKLKNQPLLHPLLTLVGITILYVPPRQGQELDLDNLARRVVPFFHDALKPPSDLVHTLAIDDMLDGTSKKYFMSKRAELSRLPKVHIAGYQVLRVPRTANDPIEGDVRLLIHAAEPYTGVWDCVTRTLSEWAHDVE
jgi:hypothetical protein